MASLFILAFDVSLNCIIPPDTYVVSGFSALISDGPSVVSTGWNVVSGNTVVVSAGRTVVSGITVVTSIGRAVVSGNTVVSAGRTVVSGNTVVISVGRTVVSGATVIISEGIVVISGNADFVSVSSDVATCVFWGNRSLIPVHADNTNTIATIHTHINILIFDITYDPTFLQFISYSDILFKNDFQSDIPFSLYHTSNIASTRRVGNTPIHFSNPRRMQSLPPLYSAPMLPPMRSVSIFAIESPRPTPPVADSTV